MFSGVGREETGEPRGPQDPARGRRVHAATSAGRMSGCEKRNRRVMCPPKNVSTSVYVLAISKDAQDLRVTHPSCWKLSSAPGEMRVKFPVHVYCICTFSNQLV